MQAAEPHVGLPIYEVYKAPPLKFSVFVPFTRVWLVDKFLKMFDQIDFFREQTEVIFYNDTDDMELQLALQSYLDESGFGRTALIQSGNSAPSDVNIAYRRRRIVDMKQKSKAFLSDTDYVFCLEDDTFVPPDAFIRLFSTIEIEPDIKFVSGVEPGRWGYRIIGAWKADSLYSPTVMRTLPFKNSGLQDVDGAGWYCYITPTDLYKDAIYRFEAECLGPDVLYVLDLRRRGYRALVDWSLKCEHHNGNSVYVVDENCTTLEWERIGTDWIMKTPERNSQ